MPDLAGPIEQNRRRSPGVNSATSRIVRLRAGRKMGEDGHQPGGGTMPVADYPTYCQMLDRARAKRFAYPAINVTSLTTANAVLKGLAESQERRHHPGLDRRRRLRLGDVGQGHGAGRDLHRRARPPGGRALPHLRRPAHRPLPGRQARHSSSFRWWRRPNGAGPPGSPISSTATCSTAAPCRSRRTWISPSSSWSASRRTI